MAGSAPLASDHHTTRPLLTPDEVRNMSQRQQILFIAGMRPVQAAKLRYYAARSFGDCFDRARLRDRKLRPPLFLNASSPAAGTARSCTAKKGSRIFYGDRVKALIRNANPLEIWN
jgi:type IV secretory pathway TraG/TraD family ATPase VirD4